MGNYILQNIFMLCYELDLKANELYTNFYRQADDMNLKAFWKVMAEEEKDHVNFWKELSKLSLANILPNVFENPEEVKKELLETKKIAGNILINSFSVRRKSDTFLAALRLEYFLLHNAFFTFFHFLGPIYRKTNPLQQYNQHLDKLFKKILEYKEVSSELVFINDMLNNLLQENKKLLITNNVDMLTNIFNRRGFFATIKPLLFLAKRSKLNVGIMMIDIDNFKSINDRYGHKVGDVVLRSVADILKKKLRKSDVIGRYGGEEFIIYLSDINKNSLEALAIKLLKGIEQETVKNIPLTISIGVCQKHIEYNPEKETSILINKADKLLYKSKRSGKNKVSICSI